MRALFTLPFVVCLLACGGEPAPGTPSSGSSAKTDAGAREVPPLPGPLTLVVDGESVPEQALRDHLGDSWHAHYLAAAEDAPVEQTAADFLATPEKEIAGLVHDWLLRRAYRDALTATDDPETAEGYAQFQQSLLAEQDLEAWLGDVLPITVIEFSGPDGRTRVLDVPAQSPAKQDPPE